MGVWTKKARGRKDFAEEANRKFKSQFGRKELTSALNMLFRSFYHILFFLAHFVGCHVFDVPLLLGS